MATINQLVKRYLHFFSNLFAQQRLTSGSKHTLQINELSLLTSLNMGTPMDTHMGEMFVYKMQQLRDSQTWQD